MHGLNTFLADPTGTTVGPAWCDWITGLGITHVRCTIDADANNQLNWAALEQSADTYRAHGISVLAVLTMDMDMPWKSPNIDRHFFPNEALGYQGNPRANRYIRDFGLRAQEIAQHLVPHGITSYAIWNEPNLEALLPIGANVPVGGEHPNALAPQVWGSLCYEVAGYLRAGGALDIQAGSLSWIGNGVTRTDAHNPYGAGYLFETLAFLRQTDVRALPWSHLGINAELWWTEPETIAAQHAINQAVLSAGFTPLPLTAGEWGDKNKDFRPAEVSPTAAALSQICDLIYFEQMPLQSDLLGYGLTDWTVAAAAGSFVPMGPTTAWLAPYTALVKGTTP